MDEETKQLIIGMAKDIGTLKSDVGCLLSDVGSLKSDVGSLKSDVADIRHEFGSDIRSLKSDVGSLKSDMSDMRHEFGSDIRSLKSDIGGLSFRMDSFQFDLEGLRQDMDVGFSVVNDRFDQMEKQVDGFATQSIRFDTEDAAMRARQDRLEDRVERLERKAR